MPKPMTYCPNCGAPTEFKIPPGDDRKRNICTATGEIFYDLRGHKDAITAIAWRDDSNVMASASEDGTGTGEG